MQLVALLQVWQLLEQVTQVLVVASRKVADGHVAAQVRAPEVTTPTVPVLQLVQTLRGQAEQLLTEQEMQVPELE